MPLSIRDPRAAALARKLADKRGTSMTEAIISALQAEIAREEATPPLVNRVQHIAGELQRQAGAFRSKMSKSDIDEMWGQ